MSKKSTQVFISLTTPDEQPQGKGIYAMQIMKIIFTKSEVSSGHIRCEREDNTATESWLTDPGIAPRDMIHYVVEKHLCIPNGLFGHIKDGANLSWKPSQNEPSHYMGNSLNFLQINAMVDVLMQMLWSCEKPQYDKFVYLSEVAFERQHIESRAYLPSQFERMALELVSLNAHWQRLRPGQSITVVF